MTDLGRKQEAFLRELDPHNPGLLFDYCAWNSLTPDLEWFSFDTQSSFLERIAAFYVQLRDGRDDTGFQICAINADPKTIEIVAVDTNLRWRTYDRPKRIRSLCEAMVIEAWTVDLDHWPQYTSKPLSLDIKVGRLTSRYRTAGSSVTYLSPTSSTSRGSFYYRAEESVQDSRYSIKAVVLNFELRWSSALLPYGSDWNVYLKQHSTKRLLAKFAHIVLRSAADGVGAKMVLLASDEDTLFTIRRMFSSCKNSDDASYVFDEQQLLLEKLCRMISMEVDAFVDRTRDELENLVSAGGFTSSTY